MSRKRSAEVGLCIPAGLLWWFLGQRPHSWPGWLSLIILGQSGSGHGPVSGSRLKKSVGGLRSKEMVVVGVGGLGGGLPGGLGSDLWSTACNLRECDRWLAPLWWFAARWWVNLQPGLTFGSSLCCMFIVLLVRLWWWQRASLMRSHRS